MQVNNCVTLKIYTYLYSFLSIYCYSGTYCAKFFTISLVVQSMQYNYIQICRLIKVGRSQVWLVWWVMKLLKTPSIIDSVFRVNARFVVSKEHISSPALSIGQKASLGQFTPIFFAKFRWIVVSWILNPIMHMSSPYFLIFFNYKTAEASSVVA